MEKKYISVVLITMISISSLAASVSENIDALVNFALNNNVNYLSAILDLEQSEDDLVVDPVYYDSTISLKNETETDFSDTTNVTTLSLDVPIVEQFSLNAQLDTDLDGSLGFTYSPLENSGTNVANEVLYDNYSVYVSEYKDDLTVSITEAYLNYLLAYKELEHQNEEVELYKKLYEEQKSLYEYDIVSLVDVQDALVTYTESQNEIRDLEVALYSAKVDIYELLDIESSSQVKIPLADLTQVVELSEKAETLLDGKQFSPMSDYDVVSALNSTITLEDTFDNLDWWEPTFDLSASVDLEGSLTATVSFSTSYSDYNGDDKNDLAEEIELSKLSSAATIANVQNNIELLQNSIESDKKSIEDIKLQTKQNDLVMQEAASLLELDEYEVLDYETLELNANTLELSLFEAYINLYIDQLNLINYL
ncbi:MAG: TolC family protein [Sphaerochaetaceae bacterium]|nr:TolC family protein [Sphaerochaetaceae bacterium]